MSHTEYSAQFVQYSSVFLGLEEALAAVQAVGPLWSGLEQSVALALSALGAL